MAFSTEVKQIILKYASKHRRPQIARRILRKKNKAEYIMFFDFKLYYKSIIIETVWYWRQNRHMD